MSVQTEITRISSAKTAIASAIADKGVTVPNGTLLDGMAALIDSIEVGGGNLKSLNNGSFTGTGVTTFTLAHGCGTTPKLFYIKIWSAQNKSLLNAVLLNLGDGKQVSFYTGRGPSSSSINFNYQDMTGQTWGNETVVLRAVFDSNYPFASNAKYIWFAYG